MTRTPGVSTPSLPKASFQKTDEEYALKLFGVFNLQARSYGFNDFSQFQRPKHYIQYIEPIESDLARQVEYDMDEQDQEWLDAVNAERKKEQIDMVTYETFEIIMDRLEKEWFDLTKNIPKTDFAMPSEDSTCAICDDSEGENSNAIVFCDGCNLAVHQDCYGVPYIPEGQWLCRKCTVSPENPVSCVLCPNEGGAFKQTVTGDWVHLLCAIWVPETRVANEVFMEPITGVDKISKPRWKLKCSLCEIKEGACIQCAKASCFTAFHATCARKEKLLMPMKSTQGSEPVTLACYCEKHLPKEQQDARAAALERERAADDNDDNGPMLSKSARAYAKTYKPGPPIVPALIINRILSYIAKVQLRKRHDFVQLVARYWSLKREARRGAPLLKRLHLEPWTANGGNAQSDEDKTLKLELLCRLRDDLEKVYELTSLTRKRESRKHGQAMVIRDTVLSILAPFEHLLRDAFNRIIVIDRTDYFRHPVNKAEVPDYFDIIKKPMHWSIIEDKINNHSYLYSQEFKDDIMLVIDNAILYNQPHTAYHKTAVRIRSATQPIFEELDRRLAGARSGMRQQEQPPVDESIGASALNVQPIGDLEPPLEYLKLLVSTDVIQNESELILDKTPLEALFSFELPKFKPPPPSSKPTKPKRDRKADLERKRKEREAEAAARALEAQLRDAPYLRTRRAAAAAAATTTTTSTTATPAESDLAPEDLTETAVGVEAQPESEIEPGAEHAEVTKMALAVPVVPGEGVAERKAQAPAVPRATGAAEKSPVVGEPVKRLSMRKRGPSILPGTSDPPPLVTDVDSRGLFQFFDKGWILPPEQKRGGRKPVERLPLPPPKKKAKTGDYVLSRLSVVSTSASENQTLQWMSPMLDSTSISAPAPVAQAPPLEPQVSNLEAMDVDTSALRTTISEEPTSEAAQREASEEVRMSSVHAPSPPPGAVSAPSILSASSIPSTAFTPSTPSIHAAPLSDTHSAPAAPSTPAAPSVPAAPSIPDAPFIHDAPPTTAALSIPSVPSVTTTASSILHVPVELSVSAPFPPRKDDTFLHDGIQPKRVVQGPDGQIIVEVLDSPLIRKQKSRQKKEERRRLLLEQQRLEQEARSPVQKQAPAQPADVQSISTGTTGTGASNAAGPSRLARADGAEAESELSSLSDIGSETVEAKERTSISAPVPHEKKKIPPVRRVSISGFGVPEELGAVQPKQVLEGGTLVWAKAKTYPWWPAVVYESDDSWIPLAVKTEAELLRSKGQSIYTIQFFDKGRSWGFLSHDKLKMLGEHKELDEELLSAKSTKQKWKSAASRADCRAAYDEAMAEMETHSDIARAGKIQPENLPLPIEGQKSPVLEGASTEHAFEEDFFKSMATGDGDHEARRGITPESEEMQVDGGN